MTPRPSDRGDTRARTGCCWCPALALLAVVLLVPLGAEPPAQPRRARRHRSTTTRSLFTDGVTMHGARCARRRPRSSSPSSPSLLGYPYAYLMTRVGPRMRGSCS